MANSKRILIAGIGNIFFGDDAFGCEVARRLLERAWPEGVEVRDFGIRGLDLAYSLMDSYDCVVLIDAVSRGGEPGTLYLIEPELAALDVPAASPQTLWDAHTMDPEKVLRLASSLGAVLQGIVLVGCEPHLLNAEDDIDAGLSKLVQVAVEQTVPIVKSMVEQFMAEGRLDCEKLNLHLPAGALAETGAVPSQEKCS